MSDLDNIKYFLDVIKDALDKLAKMAELERKIGQLETKTHIIYIALGSIISILIYIFNVLIEKIINK